MWDVDECIKAAGRAWRAREDKKGEVGAAHEKRHHPSLFSNPTLCRANAASNAASHVAASSAAAVKASAVASSREPAAPRATSALAHPNVTRCRMLAASRPMARAYPRAAHQAASRGAPALGGGGGIAPGAA